ncbi:MAG: hypothetical protein AB8H86_16945 [Polyangiales bacterium]
MCDDAAIEHDDERVVWEATRNGESLASAHTFYLLLTLLGALAPFPLSFIVPIAGMAALVLGSKRIADGTYRSDRFTTLTERLELLSLPLLDTDYRGPPPERELRIDGENVPLRSARYVGTCEETKSGAAFKRWPVYLVLDERVVLVRTCTSLADATKLRGDIASKLALPERDLEPHNEWLVAHQFPGMFLPALGSALFYVVAITLLMVASITSLFLLGEFGALAFGGSTLAVLGIDRLLRDATVRGIERDLDPVVEQNLDEGVFSDLRIRVETAEEDDSEEEERSERERSEQEAGR